MVCLGDILVNILYKVDKDNNNNNKQDADRNMYHQLDVKLVRLYKYVLTSAFAPFLPHRKFF